MNNSRTPKEIVLETLRGGATERPPVALMAGGAWYAKLMNTTLENLAENEETMSATLVDMAEKIHSDIIYAGSGYTNVHAASVGGKNIVWREIGAADIEGPAVASEREFERLDIADVDRHPLVGTIQQAYKLARRKIGGECLVTITAWGPFTNGARIVGEETFIKGIYKNKAYIERVLDFVTDMLIRLFEPLADENEIDMILLGDPTASGDLISRKQFERFALPYLERFTRWAKSKNIQTMIHICGDTTDRLDLFPLMGAECVSLDHKTDILKAKDVLHGAMSFAGNVNPVEIMMSGSAGDVEREARRLLESVGGDGGFILMPGCDIPPTVPIENVETLMRVGREWRY